MFVLQLAESYGYPHLDIHRFGSLSSSIITWSANTGMCSICRIVQAVMSTMVSA